MTWQVATGTAAGTVIGTLLAVVVLFVGPNDAIVCGSGHVGNQVAQDVSRGLGGGHIDGADATYCVVPAPITWAAAGVFLVASITAGLGIGRQHP